MSTGLNQYAIYRLRRDLKETRFLRRQSYQYLLKNNRKVTSDYYRQLFLARFDPYLTPVDLRRQLEKELPTGITGKALEVSDVLALTRNGITTAYYVDSQRLVSLPGFFHVHVSAPVLSLGTTDYKIEGRPGTWTAREEYWVDGRRFLLMQSQQFGSKAAFAVLDSDGHPAAEDTFTGFSEEVIEQIREYLHRTEVIQNDTGNKAETRSEESFMTDTVTVPVSDNLGGNSNGSGMKNDEKTSRFVDKHIVKVKKKSAKRNGKSKKKRKGPRPLWSRDSVIERLRKYQMKLAEKRLVVNAFEVKHLAIRSPYRSGERPRYLLIRNTEIVHLYKNWFIHLWDNSLKITKSGQLYEIYNKEYKNQFDKKSQNRIEEKLKKIKEVGIMDDI